MTSLLKRTVAHSTRPSFRAKTNNQSWGQLSKSCQKLDVILEHKVVSRLKFSKNVNKKKNFPNFPKLTLINKKILESFGFLT